MNNPKANWTSDPSQPSEANITADGEGWRTLDRLLAYDGSFAKVYHETVSTPTRPDGVTWTVVRRKSAVAIAAKTVDAKWLLIRQERIPIRSAIWEFPAGQIEFVPGDFSNLLHDTVWRELREETGYSSSAKSVLTPLGVFFPSAGFTDEHSHIFLADQLVPHADGPQHDVAESIIECRAFSTAELTSMIACGEICDANTLATYARLVAMNLLTPMAVNTDRSP